MDIINRKFTYLALLFTALTSPSAHGLQVMMGDASCDGAGTCTIDNLDSFSDNLIDNEVLRFELRENQKIKLIPGPVESINGQILVTLFYGWTNEGVTTVDVTRAFRFFDDNNGTVGPDIASYTTTAPPSVGGSGYGNLTTFGIPDASFVISGIEETWSCPACAPNQIEIGANPDFYSIRIWNLDANSQVVPIPPAVWLFGSGLLGLIGIARRRKA